MKLLILGAAGKTGTELVTQALAAGHEVTAFVRPTHLLQMRDPHLRIVVGDARNAQNLKNALRRQDAVISTVSSNKTSRDLITASCGALVSAMDATRVKRVILMSSFLVAPSYKPGLIGKLAGVAMKNILTDKRGGEVLLRRSDSYWTIVYATRLNNDPAIGNTRVVGANESVSLSNKISRADVASFILAQLTNRKSIGKSLVITAR